MANPSTGGWSIHGAEGAPVAFLLFRGAAGEGEILRIGTVTERRGGGLAALLLREFLGHCRGAGWTRLSLEVRPGNAAALRLYRSAGFASAGRCAGAAVACRRRQRLNGR